MNLPELLETCDRLFLLLSRDGDELVVTPLLPERHDIPNGLVPHLRALKWAILERLDFETQADELLLASTARVVRLWPAADAALREGWQQVIDAGEEAVRDAYRAGSLAALGKALQRREALVESVARAHEEGPA